MHHIITVKAWASDADEAQSEVSSTIEDSIDQSENTCGWDYAGDIVQITPDQLKTEGFKSFADLEKFKIQERLDTQANLQAEIRTDLQMLIAPFFLSKEEAVLYVSEDQDTEFTAYIEKLLKRKRDIKKPDTFEKILDIFTNVVTGIAKKDCGRSLLMFRMEQIKKLQYCIKSPTHTCYTLQSTENYFAELPCEQKGLSPFYFLCDRHY